MLKILALVTATATPVTAHPVAPQCEYARYMSAAIWSALDDAERNRASVFAIHNIEATLRDSVATERRVCGG